MRLESDTRFSNVHKFFVAFSRRGTLGSFMRNDMNILKMEKQCFELRGEKIEKCEIVLVLGD